MGDNLPLSGPPLPYPQPGITWGDLAAAPKRKPRRIHLARLGAQLHLKRFAEYMLWRAARKAARAGDSVRAARFEAAADIKATEQRRIRYGVVRALQRGAPLIVRRRGRPSGRPYKLRAF